MQEDLLNILKHSNKDIDNQKLMDYIHGKLSADEKHEVEKWMIDEPFFSEAAEGLQQVNNEGTVRSSVDQINKQLHNYLRQKRGKKNRRGLPDNYWTYIAIIVILLIAILTWVVVSKL